MKNNKGFTLIELVVVMAIIASLTALAAFNFNQARARARDVQRKSELKAIQNALELYKNDQMPQAYPATAQFTQSDATNVLVTGGYLGKLPVDPKEKTANGSWMDYTYTQVTSLSYTLQACLENTADPDKLGGACGSGGSGVLYQLTQP